jgi:WD and tetratricopeptide repeat-containing protein 1
VQQRAFEALMELEEEEDGGFGGMEDDDDDMEEDGDDDDEDEEDEDEDELDEDEFGDPLEMDEDAFDEVDPRSAQSEFGGVEMLVPRRSFKGARNVETVKDCEWNGERIGGMLRCLHLVALSLKCCVGNFLGVRSDKVCSGSDDGNFFVWDKDTGRLEGIYEGDGSVVNGEQRCRELYVPMRLISLSNGATPYTPDRSRQWDRQYRQGV